MVTWKNPCSKELVTWIDSLRLCANGDEWDNVAQQTLRDPTQFTGTVLDWVPLVVE